MGSYCDIIGVRAFAGLKDRDEDYRERVISQFIRHSGRPVFSMEAATRHPLQSFADLITIEEFKTVERPKVVLTWAPHPKALPQAVPNSFAEWMNAADYDLSAMPPWNTTSAEHSKEHTSYTRKTGVHTMPPIMEKF